MFFQVKQKQNNYKFMLVLLLILQLIEYSAAQCSPNDPKEVQGITAAPPFGQCSTCTATSACPGFNWRSAFVTGYRYVFYGINEGIYAACTTELQIIKNAGLMVSPQINVRPNQSPNGATQAESFVRQGGAWVKDGLTLPGSLHLEFAPGVANCDSAPTRACCYNLSPAQMQTWLTQFDQRYTQLTGRKLIVSTDVNAWQTCTNNWNGLTANRLEIGRICDGTTTRTASCPLAGPKAKLPWTMETFWLYKRGPVPGFTAKDLFIETYHGTLCQLKQFAATAV